MDVFDRMQEALTNAEGIELAYSDLEFMYAMAGEALRQARRDIEHWNELAYEYGLTKGREDRANAAKTS